MHATGLEWRPPLPAVSCNLCILCIAMKLHSVYHSFIYFDIGIVFTESHPIHFEIKIGPTVKKGVVVPK